MSKPLALVFLMAAAGIALASPDLCDYEYLLPPNAIIPTANSPLDTDTANVILLAHNKARRDVNPFAKEMPLLQWDPALAQHSQQHISKCLGMALSPATDRVDAFGYARVGQSIVAGPAGGFNASAAIQQMADEGAFWTYPRSCAQGKTCGRYEQMIWAKAARVGCGFHTCGDTTYWACSYSAEPEAGFAPYNAAATLATAAYCSGAKGPIVSINATTPPLPQPLDGCDRPYLVPSNAPSPSIFFTGAQVNSILLAHNKARRNVVPYAQTMPMLTWSSRLASFSKGYADTCPSAPSDPTTRPLHKGLSIGQSVVVGQASSLTIASSLDQMVGEEQFWSYPFYCAPGGANCSRYMQMIWAETTEVGCAMATCGSQSSFVCSYSIDANLPINYNMTRNFFPYTAVPTLKAASSCTAANGRIPIEDLCTASYVLPPGAISSTAVVTTDMANAILEAHNTARRNVIPYAKEMPMLTWDDELASYSQEFIDTCPGLIVSDPEDRMDPDRFGVWYIGQSIAAGPAEEMGLSVGGAVNATAQMLAEEANWAYPVCKEGHSCLRYKQIIWGSTTRVGCGYKSCGFTATGPPAVYWVCSYAVGGNIYGGEDLEDPVAPYEKAASAADAANCTADLGPLLPPVPTVTPPHTGPDACDDEYLFPNNTVSPSPILPINVINDILRMHNRARRDVFPLAKYMPMLRWDQVLADYSQGYMDTCPGAIISPYDDRVNYDKFGVWYVGQSIAYGPSATFSGPNGHIAAVQQWLNQRPDWRYPQRCTAGKRCGGYTQIIWADTLRIGCGVRTCGSTPTGPAGSTFWACSYAVGGNMRDTDDLAIGYDPYELAGDLEEAAPCSGENGWIPSLPTTTTDMYQPTTTTPLPTTTTATGAPTSSPAPSPTPSSTPGHTDCPTCPPRPSCPTCVIPTLPPCPPGGCTLFPTCPSGNCNIPCTGPFCWNSNTTCILGWCTSDGINYWSNSAPSAAPSTAGALLAALGLAAIVAQLLA